MKCVCVVVMMMMMFIHCSSEHVKGADHNVPLYAEPGSNILLPCRTEPSTSVLNMRVEWFRPSLGNLVVHLYKNQKIINTDQHSSYSGRTNLSMEELQKGNASLLLTNVQVSDDGDYVCEIQAFTWNDHVSVKLNVEAVGTDPVITLETRDYSGGATVLCEFKGWFPLPELQWLGDQGINLTDGIQQTRDEGGLFDVKNRVYVPNGASNMVYCRLKLRHHMKQAVLNIPYMMSLKAMICILIMSVLIIIIAVGVFWLIKRRVKQLREECAAKVRRLDEELAEKEGQLREEYPAKVKRLKEECAAEVKRLKEEYAAKERVLEIATAAKESLLEIATAAKESLLEKATAAKVLQVLTYVREGPDDNRLDEVSLSSVQWAALSVALCNSEEEMKEFRLSKYRTSHEALVELKHVIQSTKKALLRTCALSAESCKVLSPVLSSDSCNLIELDLSNNDLYDSGVKSLCTALTQPQCKLQILRLMGCSLSDQSCKVLSEVLSSDSCNLIELNLSYNHDLKDSGVNSLCDALKQPQCKLEILRLRSCALSDKSCSVLSPVLSSDSCNLIELELSSNKLCDSGVNSLCDALTQPQCKLQILRLRSCALSDKSCSDLSSVLSSDSCKLIELELSYNNLKDSGAKILYDKLKQSKCKLEKLRLSECALPAESCSVLSSVLSSGSCNLIELDLSSNKELKDSGVKLLCDALKQPQCKLQILRLSDCSLSDKSCSVLSSVLSSGSCKLIELDLSYNHKLKNSGVKLLCDALTQSQCKLKKLRLRECHLPDESCSVLSSVLSSDSCKLIELNLSFNDLYDSGVNFLCAALKQPQCKLQILRIEYCGITDEGCSALAKALETSNLRELYLTTSEPEGEGLKKLRALKEDSDCNLEKLKTKSLV